MSYIIKFAFKFFEMTTYISQLTLDIELVSSELLVILSGFI
ncbi:TPA: hypothetical protein RRN07_001071 [Staphylococcus argenteus]|nr:hypothetical protein [Staphylococcus argenteus]MBE2132973.1 hypothetical protein [Staphylococcus argenteus]MBE2146516.1 hypothetical protein [Staphylococcus argenteus]MBE2160681.1 hypothetical protein [Staphylococcus argenteus]MCG9797916.1 hypothetical protein [Staphylococcus argenteus]MCG9800368.1 hypothetical protein [Staphylococcus argenteus]